MNRYTVEAVKDLGDYRYETWLRSPEGISLTFVGLHVGETLEEVIDRAWEKCGDLNKMYGPEKHNPKESPYRTINKALLEEQEAAKKKRPRKYPTRKDELNRWAKFIAEKEGA